ncbi:CPBP family intramembrane glutamic endopeptidase [Altibacter sp. HG106]|uniref:CPBP family intramembrane glutamic endopeptidase n=1 Tax=Altibacter sp. HG106 TaxID=3023937 RepID=UPI002350FDB3|nr:CPBP family intramembrane glutamic endopeptidase [Altibacter sp. HG106]MDC7995647.1 CPBP family intramembrane metalloprotease [Altibacter sp. HG106]
MSSATKNLLIICVSFALYFIADDLFFKPLRTLFFEHTQQLGISHILAYLLTGIPLFLGVWYIVGRASVWEYLGLKASVLKALVFALICTAPMFLGFGLLFEFSSEISINTILIGVVSAAFFEELYFRAFLVGMPFRTTKLGFLPAVLFGALYFAALHGYQSTEIAELAGIFLVTFLGGVLFAWVYIEWEYNSWVPIFLHLLMNLSWELFSVSDTALGGGYANGLRLVTIVLVIVLIIVYKKRSGKGFNIHKKTLWVQKTPA